MNEPAKAKTTAKKTVKKTDLKVVGDEKKATAKKKKVVKKAKVEVDAEVEDAEVEPKKLPAKRSVPTGMLDAEKLRDEARMAYGNFQKSWYEFAKVVAHIHNNDIWTTLGHETFKAYCQEEFRDIGYTTIFKFIQVVNSWGDAIEDRLKKNPHQLLPSYETCYTLTAAQDRFPKAEVPKLRKQVLDGKVTVRDMRERVADLRGESNRKDDDAAERKIQKDLDNAQPLSVKLSEGDGVDDACDVIEGKVDFLIENLPLFTKALKEPTEKLVALATKIQDVLVEETINPFLDRIGEIAGEE